MAETQNAVPASAMEMTPAARCMGVFTDPARTFASIARKPDFWTPLIVVTAITIVVVETLLSRVGVEHIVRRSIEMSGRASTMTPEQIQKAITQGSKITAVVMHVSGVLSVPIMVLVLAVVGMFIMKFFFGELPRFKTAYSVTAYANLPMFLAGILALIVVVLGDPASINPRNLTPTNIGFFLSSSVSKPLLSLATSVDFFSFWLMGLLGIAFASTVRKARPRSVFLCFLGLWVLFVLIRAGLMAL